MHQLTAVRRSNAAGCAAAGGVRRRGHAAQGGQRAVRGEEARRGGGALHAPLQRTGAPAARVVVVLSNRAAARLELGKAAAALADCQEALRLEPDSFKVMLRAARCHGRLAAPGAMVAMLERAAALPGLDHTAQDKIAGERRRVDAARATCDALWRRLAAAEDRDAAAAVAASAHALVRDLPDADLELVADSAPLVFDTRNAFGTFSRPNIVRL